MSTKKQLYSKKPSFMFLVVTLQHVLLCYVAGFVAGAEVGLSLLGLDDWFATTQTKGKKARTFVRKKALHQ